MFVLLFFVLGVAFLMLLIGKLSDFLMSLLIFGVVLFLYILVVVLYRYKRFGISEFSIFYKHKETKFIDMLLMMLDKIPGFRRIVKISSFTSDMILIDGTGIYLMKIQKYRGTLTGNRENAHLQVRENLEHTTQIDNPFPKLDQEKGILQKEYPNIPVSILLVTNNVCVLNIDGVLKEEVLMVKDFYYKMENLLKKEKVLTKEEIQKIYKELPRKVLK